MMFDGYNQYEVDFTCACALIYFPHFLFLIYLGQTQLHYHMEALEETDSAKPSVSIKHRLRNQSRAIDSTIYSNFLPQAVLLSK